jgi:hypothetical protein
MAIQWADNFGRYGTGATSDDFMRDGLPYNNWVSQCIADPDPTAAALGSRCCDLDNGGFNDPLLNSRIALPSPTSGTIGVAARYWFTAFNSGNQRQCIAVFANNVPTALACCHIEANGALTLREALTGAQIATTGIPVISTNSWNHIETSYNGTTGAMEVRVNGVQKLTGTAVTLGTVAFAHPMERIASGIGNPLYIKDLVIWDGTGSQNNSFMGTVICRRLNPDADVTLGGWVPSTGVTGFNLLDKDVPNDLSYLSADDTPPAAMRFGFDNLPPDVTSVRAIISVVRARKIDGGDANLQVGLVSGVDVDNGADRPVTTAFTYYFDISELNPASAAPWTPIQVDAMNADVDRTI